MKYYLSTYGPKLIDQGYNIIPIKKGLQHPGRKGWSTWVETHETLKKRLANGYADGGVGILTKHTPGFDIDVSGLIIAQKLEYWCAINLGETPVRVGRAPRRLLVYRTDEPFPKLTSNTYRDGQGVEHKVEILGDGQQFVAYAIHPKINQPYEWVSEEDLASTPANDLATVSRPDAEALIAYFESIVPDDWEKTSDVAGAGFDIFDAPELALKNIKPKASVSDDHIKECLHKIDPDILMKDWVKVGMALHHQFDGSEFGFELFDSWSSEGTKCVVGGSHSKHQFLPTRSPQRASSGWPKRLINRKNLPALLPRGTLALPRPQNWPR